MSRMLLRREGKGWGGISKHGDQQKWRPVAWENIVCLGYDEHCFVTSDKILKILVRDWRGNCQQWLLGFLLPTGQMVVPFNKVRSIGKELSLARLVTWFYTQWFWGVKNTQMKISNRQVSTWYMGVDSRGEMRVGGTSWFLCSNRTVNSSILWCFLFIQVPWTYSSLGMELICLLLLVNSCSFFMSQMKHHFLPEAVPTSKSGHFLVLPIFIVPWIFV